MLFLLDWVRFALATEANDLWSSAQICSRKLNSLLGFVLFCFLTFSIPPCRWLRHAGDGRGAAWGVPSGKHGSFAELHTLDGQDPAQTVPGQKPPQHHPQPRPSHSQSNLGSISSSCSCRSLSFQLISFILTKWRSCWNHCGTGVRFLDKSLPLCFASVICRTSYFPLPCSLGTWTRLCCWWPKCTMCRAATGTPKECVPEWDWRSWQGMTSRPTISAYWQRLLSLKVPETSEDSSSFFTPWAVGYSLFP